MKQLKKALALALALALAMALAVPAFAAGTQVTIPGTSVTIELPGKPGDLKPGDQGSGTDKVEDHTYEAYQIFAAKYAQDAAGSDQNDNDQGKELIGIKWGDGINAEAFLTDLKASTDFGGSNPFKDITYTANNNSMAVNPSALAVAVIVSEWNDDARARAFAALADANKTGTGIAEGTSLDAGYYLIVDTTTGGLRNLATLTMSNNDTPFDPKVKVDVPEMEKKVLEINDSETTGTDAKPTTQWADVADYDIEDIVPFVLTGTVPTNYSSYKTYQYVFHDTLSAGLQFDSTSVQVYVNGAVITADKYSVVTEGLENGETFAVAFVDLKTVLPDNAVNNDTTIQVLYTAKLTGENVVVGGAGNPNSAYLQYSNNPNAGGDGDTGTTPPDKVAVFTFSLTANKTGEDGAALPGAGFTLYKLYTNQADAPTAPALPTGVDAIVTGNEGTYYAVTRIAAGDTTEFTFKGLDAGKYMLRETEVPAGYNRAEDMFFTVTATEGLKDGSTDYEVKTLVVSAVTDANGIEYKNGDEPVFKIDPVPSAGTLSTSIVNLRGVVLPSTGGIGTTIFYLVGGLCVAAAVVLLITKKRMGKQE